MAFFSWLDDDSDITAILFHNTRRFNPVNAATQNILRGPGELSIAQLLQPLARRSWHQGQCGKSCPIREVSAKVWLQHSVVCALSCPAKTLTSIRHGMGGPDHWRLSTTTSPSLITIFTFSSIDK